MKAVLQRVLSASVTVDQTMVSSIGKGILVLAAMAPGDTEKEADSLASKVLKLKLWSDESGRQWKKNVQEIDGKVLCVSQFTLLGSTKKGNKPDFHGAMNAEDAKKLYAYFFSKVQEGYAADKVQDGVFQAMMEVALVNDGPVTLELSAHPPKQDKQEKLPAYSNQEKEQRSLAHLKQDKEGEPSAHPKEEEKGKSLAHPMQYKKEKKAKGGKPPLQRQANSEPEQVQ